MWTESLTVILFVIPVGFVFCVGSLYSFTVCAVKIS